MFEFLASIFDFFKVLLECCIICSNKDAPPQDDSKNDNITVSVPDGAPCHIEVDVGAPIQTPDQEEKRVKVPHGKTPIRKRGRKRSRSVKKTTTTTTTQQTVETTEVDEGSGTPSPETTGGVADMSKAVEKTTI